MTYNAAERKDIRKAEKAARLAEVNRGEVIKALASTEPGRRYLWDRLSAAHIFVTSFSTDPLQMAFAEGERNQGLQLLNDIIQWCPEQFIQAMREHNEQHITSGAPGSEFGGSEDGDGGDQEPSPAAGDEASADYRHPSED